MKKTYVQPQIKEFIIKTHQVLMTSNVSVYSTDYDEEYTDL